jgi:phosphate-selective porin OprO/OprP
MHGRSGCTGRIASIVVIILVEMLSGHALVRDGTWRGSASGAEPFGIASPSASLGDIAPGGTDPPADDTALDELPPDESMPVDRSAATAIPDRAAAGPTPADEDPPIHDVVNGLPLTVHWHHGLALESPSRDFAIKVGGRVQIDTSAYTEGAGPAAPPAFGGLNPPLNGATNFRRARIRVEGRMYEVYDWAMEYDFANQLDVNNEAFPTERDIGPLPAITDAWVQIRELPVLGIVRIGNQKDPFGYEHLTSSRWLNFMERSFTMDAFVGPFNNGFQPGIKILNASDDGRVIWQVGEFKNTSNVFGASATDGGSQTVGRLVVLPVFEGEGERLVHLGVAGRTMGLKLLQTEFDPATGLPTGPEVPAVRFRSRGDVRNGPPGPVNSIYADAGLLEGSWQNMIGLEFVGNDGPLSWQAEYIGSWLYDAVTTGNDPINAGRQPPAGTKVGTVFYQGGYVEVLYFLTGETRTYSRLEGVFDRPIPRNTFYVLRGARRLLSSPGAWQVGARYNCLSLNDGEVNGGVLNAVTLGLNWLWTPNARVYFNYDFTYRDFVNLAGFNGSGGIHAFGTRLAFDF